MRKSTILFVALTAFALAWVALMSLGLTPESGNAVASDGATARITWLAWESSFPLIEVYLNVLDTSGAPLRGLEREAFRVNEDAFGAPLVSFTGAGFQTVSAMLVVDRSGSMEGNKLAGAREAALRFVQEMRPDQDEIGVIAFNETVERLQMLTADDTLLQEAIGTLEASGGTAFYDAVSQALEALEGAGGRRIVLALTDGLDNDSVHEPEDVIARAAEMGVALYTIGLGETGDIDPTILERMAAETGGEFQRTPAPETLADLYRRLFVAVQNEYVLGYRSPTPELDGSTRTVEIFVERSGGDLVASESYTVSGILSASFAWDRFLPIFFGPLLLLLFLLFLPRLLARRQRAPTPPGPTPGYEPATRRLADLPPAENQAPEHRARSGDTCPHCGQRVRPEAQFCSACGQTLVPPASPEACPRCGAPLRPGARFCGHCGAPLVS